MTRERISTVDGSIGVSDSRLHYPIVDDWIEAAESYGIERTPTTTARGPVRGPTTPS